MAKSVPPIADEILVVAAILGDMEAFDDLVVRYRGAVVRFAGHLIGSEDAEDVAQDVLLLAFKALPSIDDPARFGAWLRSITRHRASRFDKQQRGRQSGRIPLDEVLLDQIGSLSEPLVERRIEDAATRAALLTLPEDYAFALQLHYLDELPIKRVAAFLGVPLSTIKWRLHKGRKLLRANLETEKTQGVKHGKGRGDLKAGQRITTRRTLGNAIPVERRG